MRFRKFSAASTAMLMLAGSSMAMAQNSVTQPDGSANGGSPVAPDTDRPTANLPGEPTQATADAPAADDGGVADIIVTAQRFSTSAQKTPLIISVIGADELRGVSQIAQLQSVNPGVSIATSGGLTQTFVRGVGSATVLTGQESAIAYNADGVYLFSSSMITPLMYDLDRIEVLKGPQGTLYGRNASGGVVNIITAGARLDKMEGYVEGELGNYDRYRATGAVNIPIGETFAVRLAGQHVEHDGYLSDGTEDQNLTAGRLRARWEPSADVTLQIGADVSRQGGRGPGTTLNPNPTDVKWIGGSDPRVNTGLTALFTTQNDKTFLRNHQWSVNAQLDVNLGFATLTVLPAFRHEDGRYLNYGPGFGDNQEYKTNEKTIEARLAKSSDQLKWVVGAYYFKNDNSGESLVNQDLIGSVSNAAVNFEVTSYAFFGEATFSVSDTVRLIGGARYTHEETHQKGQNNGLIPNPVYDPFDPVTNPTGDIFDFVINGEAKASAVTWKGGAEFDLSPSSLLFATASRGFKGGGTYANNPGLASTFKPEYLTAFELGSRNRFLDNTLQLNGEIFYWKLKNQQQTYLANNAFLLPVLTTANAGKAHMYGGTIDLVWRPTPNDSLRGGVEYTKSKYDSFTRVLPAFAVIGSTTCTVTPSGPGPFADTTVDCTGKPLVRAPKWSASAGYEHRFDFENGSTVTFNGDMTFTSGRWLSVNYVPLGYQKSNAMFNAALEYQTPNKAVSVTGWIRNIGNSKVYTVSTEFTSFYTRAAVMAPRTFGASVRFAF